MSHKVHTFKSPRKLSSKRGGDSTLHMLKSTLFITAARPRLSPGGTRYRRHLLLDETLHRGRVARVPARAPAQSRGISASHLQSFCFPPPPPQRPQHFAGGCVERLQGRVTPSRTRTTIESRRSFSCRVAMGKSEWPRPLSGFAASSFAGGVGVVVVRRVP